MQPLFLPLLFACLLTWVTAFILSGIFAKRTWFADVPNNRSSHQVVTSRAGGLAIVIGWCIGAACILCFTSETAFNFMASLKLIGLTLVTAGFGLIDDRYLLKPGLKFFSQMITAVLFVILFGIIQTLPLPFVGEVQLGSFGIVITLIWLVGLMNAFNFMDGLNGIAASVATLCVLIIGFMALSIEFIWLAGMAFLLTASIAGFLPLNMFKGKIFMGDTGSQAISFLLGAFSIFIAAPELVEGVSGLPTTFSFQISFLFGPVILLPFIADVALTLWHRHRRGENLLKAHRQHNYQLLNRLGLSHIQVCGLYVSASALCVTAGLLMLKLAPEWQWVIPLSILLAAFFIDYKINFLAVKAGLFDNKEHKEDSDKASTLMPGSNSNQPAE